MASKYREPRDTHFMEIPYGYRREGEFNWLIDSDSSQFRRSLIIWMKFKVGSMSKFNDSLQYSALHLPNILI